MIIVIGASGFFGQQFVRQLQTARQPHLTVSRREIDYYDPTLLAKFLADTRADFLINAAGYRGLSNVDECEGNKVECIYANSVLPGRIRLACESEGVPWGHVSSGCIYAGRRDDGKGFCESDKPNFSFRFGNSSFYSGTKALAEELLADARECFIWRARMPFSHVDHPKNYLSKLLRYGRLLEATNSLSQLDEFVSACLDCWNQRVPFGTYNLTNTGCVRTSEVVDMLRETIAPNRSFDFFKDEREFMRVAQAPRSSCYLDNSKAIAAGLRLSNVRDAIASALHQWRDAGA